MDKWAFFMFMPVLSIWWGISDVMTPELCVRISVLGPTKVGISLNEGMPCTQCARSAKFWMSANTRTLVLAPFHKFLVPYQGFFGFQSI